MSDTLIKVEGLYKKFCTSLKRSMAYGTIDAMRSMIGFPIKEENLRKKEFWALQDINFELKRGETLGIIGQNGCGKSTLLRLINGIFPPDRGKITINGRIGALIAVGAGFHPHMTGRENVYLNGTILGMKTNELKRKFDEIVDFAEIGEFIDAPVATYSSGMTVRLGFAIAIHCEPDILLVDEILSVGDLSFRNKSLRKMAEYKQNAKGIIFVSHALEQVRILCNNLIIMEKGNFIYNGDVNTGLVKYEESSHRNRLNEIEKSKDVAKYKNIKHGVSTNEEIETIKTGFLDANKNEVTKIGMYEPLIIFIEFKLKKFIEELYFSVGVLNAENRACIWVMSNDFNKSQFLNNEIGNYRAKIKIAEHHLVPGIYYMNYAFRNANTLEMFEKIFTNTAVQIVSDGKTLERGVVVVSEKWELEMI